MYSLGEDLLLYLSSPEMVDRVGMQPTIMTLGATLWENNGTRNVQIETTIETSTWFGIDHNAGAAYLGTNLGCGINGEHFSMTSPTSGRWFK